nr:cysteine desulfurase family protein [Neoroseomonas lacus]
MARSGPPAYFDHHATTPVDPRVREAMLPFLGAFFGNAGSAEHPYGWRAQSAVEGARRDVAALVGARPADVVFTSGATEANNLALLGAQTGARRHLITTSIEHASVLACAAEYARRGGTVTYLPVDGDGLVHPDEVAAAIRPDTGLISMAFANHEIGAIQPIQEIGVLAKRHDILLHVDAAQAAGRIPISRAGLQADFISLSAHKIYGPQGVGALIVARDSRDRLAPILFGAGQERGLRPGTLPVPLIVGFGMAAALALRALPEEPQRIAALRELLLERLRVIPGLRIHGGLTHRLAGNLNLGWPRLVARDLIYLLRNDVAISSGSACGSGALHPSPVLQAIGLTDAQALGALRIGLGRFTTRQEVVGAARAIIRAAESPG